MTKNNLEDIAKGNSAISLGSKAMGLRQEERHVTKLILIGPKEPNC